MGRVDPRDPVGRPFQLLRGCTACHDGTPAPLGLWRCRRRPSIRRSPLLLTGSHRGHLEPKPPVSTETSTIRIRRLSGPGGTDEERDPLQIQRKSPPNAPKWDLVHEVELQDWRSDRRAGRCRAVRHAEPGYLRPPVGGSGPPGDAAVVTVLENSGHVEHRPAVRNSRSCETRHCTSCRSSEVR